MDGITLIGFLLIVTVLYLWYRIFKMASENKQIYIDEQRRRLEETRRLRDDSGRSSEG